jgi:hypothetical protein
MWGKEAWHGLGKDKKVLTVTWQWSRCLQWFATVYLSLCLVTIIYRFSAGAAWGKQRCACDNLPRGRPRQVILHVARFSPLTHGLAFFSNSRITLSQ